MIKKILYVLVIILAGYGCYIVFTQGFSRNLGFLKLEIPSYASVQDDKKNLDKNLSRLDGLISKDLVEAEKAVTEEDKNFKTKQAMYLARAEGATKEQIAEANKEEVYLLDFLWMRIGKYASDNDVKWKMDYDGEETLSFNITGSYISVINFIYDIENDNELDFGIEGIVIEGGSSDAIVKANFVVEGVQVITAPLPAE